MSINPCAVIPVYNHDQHLPRVVEALQQHNLHCILVDDGSDEVTRQAVLSISESNDSVTLFRLGWNQGKGAAVMEGLIRAQEMGYTHAVQVDADGQHDCDRLLALVSAAETYPEALISGLPEYDACAPKSRLYGRLITRFWVWIETLSTDIKDAMVGFRVYPLAATCQLIRDVDLTRRMDFDIEIIVRLYWKGIPVVGVPVRIIYPEEGVSHFDTLKDNLRISWLHTRLFFGMLRRAKGLLKKRFLAKDPAKHWSKIQERGSELGIRFLLGTYRLLGHRVFSMMLWPVMVYFFATGRSARKASMGYLQKLYEISPSSLPRTPDWQLSLKHFLTFGHSLADRFGAWLGRIPLEQLDITGQALLDETLSRGKGAVILVSHYGNSELCRALAQYKTSGPALKVNVLVHTHHALIFNKVLGESNPGVDVRLLQVSDIGPDTSIMLSGLLDAGEIVAIAADRLPESKDQTFISAAFLGEKACFPKGPFILASILKAPVFTLFCARRQSGRFAVDVEHFADPLHLPRKERQRTLEKVLQNYAKRLEEACKASPLEWFNFFDFWQKP